MHDINQEKKMPFSLLPPSPQYSRQRYIASDACLFYLCFFYILEQLSNPKHFKLSSLHASTFSSTDSKHICELALVESVERFALERVIYPETISNALPPSNLTLLYRLSCYYSPSSYPAFGLVTKSQTKKRKFCFPLHIF